MYEELPHFKGWGDACRSVRVKFWTLGARQKTIQRLARKHHRKLAKENELDNMVFGHPKRLYLWGVLLQMKQVGLLKPAIPVPGRQNSYWWLKDIAYWHRLASPTSTAVQRQKEKECLKKMPRKLAQVKRALQKGDREALISLREELERLATSRC